MSRHAFNQTFTKQQQRLVRATFKKGFISAVHSGSGTADVYYADNPQSIIRNVPLAKSVTVASVMAGQRCRIDVFDETNPNDAVVAYVY